MLFRSPAVLDCLAQAEAAGDTGAIEHLRLHKLHYDQLFADAQRYGSLDGVTLLGDPPPTDEEGSPTVGGNQFAPRIPVKWEELGLPSPFLFDMILRVIFTRGQLTGGEIANELAVPFPVLGPVLQSLRKQTLIDIVGQRGSGGGDNAFVYEIKDRKSVV